MKTLWKRALLVPSVLLILMVMSACGGAANPPTDGSGITSNTPTATSSYGSGDTDATPTATTASSGGATVKTATAMVDGKSETILTDANGMTLYYFTQDTAQKTACTGACAETWPPLLFNGSGDVTASTQLPGELEAYKNDNGNQVLYNDHFLYTYVADKAPGDTNGQGVGNKWYVATPDLAK